MVTGTLAQACRITRVPRCTAYDFRCFSTSRQPSTKPRPKPNDQTPRASGQAPKSYDQTPKPHGQPSKPFGQTPKTNAQKSRAARAPFKAPKSTKPESEINPKVSVWAKAHNVGFPRELKTVRLKDPTHRQSLVVFRFAPRQVFRGHHMYDIFTGHEKVATAYTLYRYEQRLGIPLWLHIEGSHNPRPVVRNFARRRVREGIRAALVERGYTFEGKVAGTRMLETGGAQIAPKKDLTGTVELFVQDPVTVANKSKEKHVEFGRQVVSGIEEQLSAAPRSESPRRNYRV